MLCNLDLDKAASLDYEQIDTSNGSIFIWQAPEHDKVGMSKRDFEAAEINKFLSNKGFSPGSLKKTSAGAPFLLPAGSGEISISHSDNYFAVYLSKETCGIDIQCFKKRMKAGRDYYTNDKEAVFTEDLDLHLIWGAKEAVFKYWKGEVGNPAHEFTVDSIDHVKKKIVVLFNEIKHQLTFISNAHFVLVYTQSI